MSAYQVILTSIVVILGTVLMLMLMRRNARRAIAKREAHTKSVMKETERRIEQIRRARQERLNYYPPPSQQPINTRRATEDDYVGPAIGFDIPDDTRHDHHHHHDHGSTDSWSEGGSSDSGDSGDGGGDGGGD